MTARIIQILQPGRGTPRSYGFEPREPYEPPSLREITVSDCPETVGDSLAREAIEAALTLGYGGPLPVRWPDVLAFLAKHGIRIVQPSRGTP